MMFDQTSDIFRMTSAKIQPQKREVKFSGKNFQNISAFCSEHFFVCLQARKRLHEVTFPDDGRWQMAVVLKREWQPI